MKLANLLIEGKTKLTDEEEDIAQFFARNGLKTKYDKKTIDEYTKEWGPDFVKKALAMAPKLIAFEQKLDQIAEKLKNTKEAQILMARISHSRGFGGSSDTRTGVRDLFPR